MPGIQWLGDIPKETSGGYLAKALGQGVSTGIQSYEDRRRWEEEMDLKRGELKYKLANLDQSKLMDVVNTMNRVLQFVDKDKRAEMLNDPEIQAVFDAAGVPIPREEVEESPWAGTSWLDRTKAAVTPWATEMEQERGGLRPGGVFSPPVTRTRPPTPRSSVLPSSTDKEVNLGKVTVKKGGGGEVETFASEQEARARGKKTGDVIIITGVGKVRLK